MQDIYVRWCVSDFKETSVCYEVHFTIKSLRLEGVEESFVCHCKHQR